MCHQIKLSRISAHAVKWVREGKRAVSNLCARFASLLRIFYVFMLIVTWQYSLCGNRKFRNSWELKNISSLSFIIRCALALYLLILKLHFD